MGISAGLGPAAFIPTGYGFRNLLINGDFRIAQRGTNFTSLDGRNNDNTYNLDRWVLLSEINNVAKVYQSTDAPTGGLNSLRAQYNVFNNRKFGLLQVIEQRNIVGIQDKQVWLSFKAKTSGSSINDVKAVVLSWTGTADSVTRDVVSTWNSSGVVPTWETNWTAENTPVNLNVTNSWATYTVSATVDTANTKNVAVFIWCDDTTTSINDELFLTDVQLEINNVVTPFERRPVGLELALCQRYYQRFNGASTYSRFCAGTAETTGYVNVLLPVYVPMRTMVPANQTISYSAIGTTGNRLYLSDGTAIFNLSALAISNIGSERNIGLACTTSGVTVFRNYYLEETSTGDEWIAVACEL